MAKYYESEWGMREYFRGVVWPRQKDGEVLKNYRYVVVGVLVTDRPLDMEDNQTIFSGHCDGLAESLKSTHHRVTDEPLGDATNVLLSLNDYPYVDF